MRLTFSVFIILGWLLLVFFGSILPLQPEQIDLQGILKGPGMEHILGQDDLGRSILSRLILGAKTSLLVSFSVVTLSALTGTLLGTLAAWFGGRTDLLMVWVIDLFMAFPGILLAIALAGLLGPGMNNLIIALSVVGWVGFARLARAQTLAVKHQDHIAAAITMGIGVTTIIRKHIIPLIAAPLIVEATFAVASVIVAEAGLSFLGIGIQAPESSWGNMIRDGSRYLLVAPHLVIAPGMALALVVVSVNLLGDQIRDLNKNSQ